MDLHEAVEYLRELRQATLAAETTDWSLVDAVNAVLTALREGGIL